MHLHYLIAFGSNLGQRESLASEAVERLSQIGQIKGVSSLYSTEPLGPAQHNFVNGALLLYSSIDPELMMTKLLTIEEDMGRERRQKWGDRTMDLDIILIQDDEGRTVHWQSPSLQVPHPEMKNRDFVLAPAEELVADWLVEGESVARLRQQCPLHSILEKKPFPLT